METWLGIILISAVDEAQQTYRRVGWASILDSPYFDAHLNFQRIQALPCQGRFDIESLWSHPEGFRGEEATGEAANEMCRHSEELHSYFDHAT